MRTLLLALAGTSLVTQSLSAAAQTGPQPSVPVRALSTPEAVSSGTFGTILGVRALPDGNVLVNDAQRRRLLLLDRELKIKQVVLDSANAGGQSYGRRASPLIAFTGDSTLFVDGASSSLLVIDPKGAVARVMAAPRPADLRFLAGGSSGVDRDGNLIYQVFNTGQPQAAMGSSGVAAPADSHAIVRAVLATGAVDTLARAKVAAVQRFVASRDDNGQVALRRTVNPAPQIDEWAVLSDGTVAVVRGTDYHVDWILPSGERRASPKLPFDWKRLTDADKQALIDSAKAAESSTSGRGPDGMGDAAITITTRASGAGGGGVSGGGGSSSVTFGSGGASVGGDGAVSQTTTRPQLVTDYPPLSAMPDYRPPVRSGAARGDMDGRLWILPSTSAQSLEGELVYDVVTPRDDRVERIRLPKGRVIAGFGPGGVVFLMHRGADQTWTLERVRLVTNAGATRP
jgi:uncharacterized membrane protein YgcG